MSLRQAVPAARSCHAIVTRICSFNLLSNPSMIPSGISSSGPMMKGGKLFSGKRNWQAQVNCWTTCSAASLGPAADLPQLLPDSRGISQAPCILTLSTPSWASPDAVQTIDLVDVLGRRGIRPAQAAMYLDTCPAIHASVWVRAGKHYRGSHLEGYAVVVLDKGRERGAFMPEGMSGLQTGSVIAAQNALGYWISWAPDDSLLRACTRQRPRRLVTPGGVFRRVSTTFANYGEGLRRVHFMLKGISHKQLPTGSKSSDMPKLMTEFMCPRLHFSLLPQT